MCPQVKYIVGYSIPHASRFQDIAYYLVSKRSHFRWPEFLFGMLWIAVLAFAKNAPRLHRCLPNASDSNDSTGSHSRPSPAAKWNAAVNHTAPHSPDSPI